MLVKVAYSYPEQLVEVKGKDGKTILVRKPGSTTRPARPTDTNTWYEER